MTNVRALLFGTAACALLVLPAAGASAEDPAAAPTAPAERRIAPGITAGGVDVGGLTVSEATLRLEQRLGPLVRKDVDLRVAGRRFVLTAKDAGTQFDATTTAKRALYAPAPDQSAAGGAAAGVDVPPAVRVSTVSLRAWIGRVATAVGRAPRNATLRIGLKRISVRRSKPGHGLDKRAAETVLKEALASPRTSRTIYQRVVPVAPTVTYKALQAQYPTIVTVSKSEFRLRVFKRLRLSKTYGVAVGQPAYPTPTGRFRIVNKQVNPTWSVPNSPWAGELGGTTVAGGSAANPLKARWMGIANGVGIHGTGQEWSIGSRASHGCIRMRVADVIDLYPRIPVGTPIVIR